MSIFDALFRPHTRSQHSAPVRTAYHRHSVRGGGRSRQRGLAAAEALERRELLAVEVARTSLNLRFSTDPTGKYQAYGEYQTFSVTNTSGVDSYTDVWFRATDFVPGQKVQLGSGEDGLYYLGSLGPNETKTAFIYMVATTFTTTDTYDYQYYTAEAWQGRPGSPGSTRLDYEPENFQWVGQAIMDDSSSKTSSVSVEYFFGGLPTSVPVVGGTMKMTVTGDVKNKPDRILFSPATSLDWPADKFELASAVVTYSKDPQLLPDEIFEKPIPPASTPKNFGVEYMFRIEGTTAAPTPVTPTQYTANGVEQPFQRKFEHSQLLEGVTDIPVATYALTVDKASYRNGLLVDTYIPGQPLRYVITLENIIGQELTNVPVNDLLPADIASASLVSVVTVNADADITLVGRKLSGTLNSVQPGGTVTITVDTVVSLSATDPLVNTFSATLPNDVTASDTDIDYHDVVLAVDKRSYRGGVLTDTYVQGAALQYVTTITNTAGITGTGIAINDQLPSKVSWTGATLSWGVTGGGSASLALNTVTGEVSGTATLDPGAVLTVTINTVVLTTASQSITNTLSATVPNGLTFSDDDVDWPAVTLVVTKTSSSPAGPATYVPGAAFQYVVAFTNNGPADETGISISDILPAKLTGVSIGSINWGGNLAGSYNLSDHTLTGTISLKRNTTVTFTINATVAPSATGTMTNTAYATLPVGTQVSGQDIDQPINLFLNKDDGRSVYYKGGTTTYQIIVRNDGAAAVTGIAFQDILTTNTNLDLALTTWSAAYTNASGTLPTTPTKNDILGTLALQPGGIVLVTINAKILPTATGNLVNTATISAGILLASSTDTNTPGGSVVPQPGDAAIIVGTDDSCSYPPSVFVLDVTGAILQTITWQDGLFEKTFRGGVRVTTGDVNRDGLADLVVGSGRGRVGEIRVFLAQQGHPGGVYYQYAAAYNTQPFGATYNAGVEVAVGDIDGDGDGDLIAARSSGTPTVSGFVVDATQADPVANTPKFSFSAFPSPYANGAMIAAGDFTGDGIVEVVTGSNSGIRATVKIWKIATSPVVTQTIYPIAPTFKGGVTVWVGRYATAQNPDDGVPDIFVGAGLAGQSITEVYSGKTAAQLLRTQAFATLSRTAAQLNLAGLDLVGNGVVTDVYGVRGLNGSGGATGVRRMQVPSTATLWLSQDARLKPPLRIASVVPPAPPPANGFRGLGASRTVRR